MTRHIDWSPMAQTDLLGIGDRSVIAELMHVALADLDERFLPVSTLDQGTVQDDPPPGVAWRRGLTNSGSLKLYEEPADDDHSRYRACDYVLVYRPPTPDEYVAAGRAGRKLDFVVVRVVPSSEYAQEISPEIAQRALLLGDLWMQFLQASSEA